MRILELCYTFCMGAHHTWSRNTNGCNEKFFVWTSFRDGFGTRILVDLYDPLCWRSIWFAKNIEREYRARPTAVLFTFTFVVFDGIGYLTHIMDTVVKWSISEYLNDWSTFCFTFSQDSLGVCIVRCQTARNLDHAIYYDASFKLS